MNIGRKIYYEKVMGNVLLVTSEMSGDVIPTTKEQDFEIYQDLKGVSPESVSVKQLNYGEYSYDFSKGRVTRIDMNTGDLIFTPFPTEEHTPPMEQISLEKRVENLEQVMDEMLLGGLL